MLLMLSVCTRGCVMPTCRLLLLYCGRGRRCAASSHHPSASSTQCFYACWCTPGGVGHGAVSPLDLRTQQWHVDTFAYSLEQVRVRRSTAVVDVLPSSLRLLPAAPDTYCEGGGAPAPRAYAVSESGWRG